MAILQTVSLLLLVCSCLPALVLGQSYDDDGAYVALIISLSIVGIVIILVKVCLIIWCIRRSNARQGYTRVVTVQAAPAAYQPTGVTNAPPGYQQVYGSTPVGAGANPCYPAHGNNQQYDAKATAPPAYDAPSNQYTT